MNSAIVFIDGGYFEKVMLYEFQKQRIDYSKIPGAIKDLIGCDCEVIRTYYYDCPPYKSPRPTHDESERFAKKERFLNYLDKLPRFEVRRGYLVKRLTETGKEKYEQKKVDVLPSVDLVRHASKGKITHAVIIAGDSDFVPALQIVKEESVLVYLLHGESPHQELYRIADERIRIENGFVKKIERV